MESQPSAILKLPSRPKGNYHNKFKPISLASNHFKVTIKDLNKVFLYRLDFEPKLEETDRLKRNRILLKCNDKISQELYLPVFSGNIIYTTKKPNWQGDKKKIALNYNSQQLTMIVKLVKTIDFKIDTENKDLQLIFLNNFLRTNMKKLGFIQIGKTKKFFDSSTKKQINNADLQLYQGFTANFCRLQAGLFLKVDSMTKIVRSTSVLALINSIYQENSDKDKITRRNILSEALIKSTVMANYGASNYWRIDNVIFDINTSNYKIGQDGLTLDEYYMSKYGKAISTKSQPLLETTDRMGKKILLIPQFCLPTGLPSNVSDHTRKEISQTTITAANQKTERINRLRKLLTSSFKDNGSASLNESLGIEIEQKLNTSKAQLIRAPLLSLGNKENIQEGRQASFRIFDRPLYDTSQKISCCLVHCGDFDPNSILNIFKSTAKNLKLDLEVKTTRVSSKHASELLDGLIKEIQYQSNKNIYNVFFVILPARSDSLYKPIKNFIYTKCDKVVAQIALQTFTRKKQFQSIATKILLQIAAKAGNILWKPVCSVTSKHNVMLIGVNTCADKLAGQKRVGFCATTNKQLTSFHSNSWVQTSNSPLIDDMGTMIQESIKWYQAKNKSFPTQIVILRDGCSVGQIKAIYETQVYSCLNNIKKFNDSGKCTLNFTFVIVDKKPTQKFFSNYQGQINNPDAGTLVNSELVNQNYEFFLVSQKSNRGTTIPTLYKIIYCNSDLEAGMLQDIVYSQCFNYVNWTGSIKIPAPMQYAKKLCDFSSTNMKQNPVSSLKDSLYFI